MRDIPFRATDRDHADVRRRRILFRCWHRGTQESDLILGSFAENSLTLTCFDWIFGVSDPPPEHDHDVMELLRSSAPNDVEHRGKVSRYARTK